MSKSSGSRIGIRVVLSLVVALATLEVCLRTLDARAGRSGSDYLPERTEPGLFVPHPFIGYALRPGARRDREDFAWSINSLGVRGPERTSEKPPGVYRILCLGGSTTFGTASTRDETTYPAQLERLLNEAPPAGVTYEVWNCGVSGYTTAENLAYLALRLRDHRPDAILLYEGGNDAVEVVTRGFRADYTHLRRAWTEVELSPIETFLVRNWRSYAWLTRDARVEQTLSRRLFVPDYEDLRQPPGTPIDPRAVATYVRNLRSIVAVARDAGIEPVIATFATCASRGVAGDEDIVRACASMNEAVRALCAELSLGCIDLAATLSDRAELFVDVMHLNDDGCRVQAELVRDSARALGLFLPR